MADKTSFVGRAVQAVRYTLSGVTPDTWMSPSQPLPPQAQQVEGRQYDFPVSYNINYLPRADRKVKFPRLKELSKSCGVLRTVIERQKDLLESFDWNVKPREVVVGKRPAAANDPAIQDIEAFLRYPDKIHDWAQWLRALLEQVFVLDALTIYRRRDRGGRPYAFELMDGATIRLLIDGSGRRPMAPDPAFQQILKGVPAVDYSTDELIYWPKNVSADNPYGYPPVEQILDYVETFIERVKGQKSYFTEGNIGDGLFSGPAEWKVDQIKAWQGYWDSIFAGNVQQRRKGWWVPNGTKFEQIKQPPLKDEFDEWLARIVCFAFSTSPQPFIKQVSRGNQESQQEVAEEGGVATYMAFVKRIMDRLIAEDFQRPDLEFVWREDREFDPLVATQIQDIRLKNGSLWIDEVRDRNGEDPLPNGLGKTPLIYTATGATPLKDVLDPPEPPAPVVMHAPGAPGQPAPGEPKPAKGGKTTDKTPPAEKLAKAAKLIEADRPKARRAAASMQKKLEPILQKTGDHVAAMLAPRLRGRLGKAADDGDFARKLADQVNLSTLQDILDATYEDLFDVASDSGQLALTSVDVEPTDALVNQVNQAAVDYAKKRAAELVSVDGDKNIVETTRNMIRDVIVKGLEDNIGGDAIADAIQESTAFSADRAELIAQTEITMANEGGKQAGWNVAASTGLDLEVFWQTSNLGCCDACETNAEASPVNFGRPFPSGDTNSPAHVRCRCVTWARRKAAPKD
jgi:hypothetical protein